MPAPHGTPLWPECRILPRDRKGVARANAVPDVKNSPPSRAHACTERGVWDSSVLVRPLVDWKPTVAACFDPLHRGGREGTPETGARHLRFAAFGLSPRRGPLPPCEISI